MVAAPPISIGARRCEMFAPDLTSVFAVVGLTILRFGVPLFGIWLLGQTLKRAMPSRP